MRLLVFGDSFVNGIGDPDHLGWVGRAVRGVRDLTLYNLGVRRETSRDIRARWRAEALARLTDDEPCALVFTYGANDCHVEDGQTAPRIAAERVLENTDAILTEARSLAPCLMVGPPPTANLDARARLTTLNPRLAEVATRASVPYLDLLKRRSELGVWIREAGEWDGAHPGAEGHQQLADLVGRWQPWREMILGAA